MSAPKSGVSIWKIIRWSVLGIVLFLLLLMFRKPQPVAERLPAMEAKEKVESFQTKLKILDDSRERGVEDSVHFSSEEINAALQQGLAEEVASTRGEKPSGDEAELPEGIRAAQVALEDDHATVQVPAQVLNRTVYLTVSAKVGVADGLLTFEFGDGRIGSLSVPAALLNRELQKRLQSPEVREKLRLPQYITDVRIEKGKLVVSER